MAISATLTTDDKQKITAQWQRDYDVPDNCIKADIRGAINDMDTWWESIAATFDSAFSDPFKANATDNSKRCVLIYILQRKCGMLMTEGE